MFRRALIIIVAVFVVFAVWFSWQLRPVNASDSITESLTIEKGESVASIAQLLKQHGLIRSALAFKIYARYKGAQAKLQAGSFSFSPSQSVANILDSLQSGKTDEISITIPEGYSVAEIDALLVSKGLGQPGDVIHCAFTCDFSAYTFLPAKNDGTEREGIGSRVEGYLFPETYFISPTHYEPQAILSRMLETFNHRIVETYVADIQASKIPLADIVTMASLIEKESRHDEERAVVSGILWKRLQAPMVLGVDATIRYALQKPTAALKTSDLDTVSPYNTRKVAGLPPTPITNPGESAIVAALHPQQSDYWYYLHGSDGAIHYARTNDEHNENKQRYLR